MPADGKRYELLEGEIYVTAVPRLRHQQIVRNLFLLLGSHVRRLGLGEIPFARLDVILSNITVIEPDLVYVNAAHLDRLSDRGIEGAPTLVIEVLSPSTAADRGVKRRISAQYGVPHYWIVDPDAQLIETYRLSGAAYQPGPRLGAIAPAALPPFSDLQLDPVETSGADEQHRWW